MRPKQNVLFAINSLAGGGAERVLTTILGASGQWRERYDLHLALLDVEPAAYAVPAGVTCHQLDARHRLGASVTQLRGLVDRLRPDVSVSFLTRANIANAWAMAGRGRPWLISERVNTAAHLGSGPGAWAARVLVRLAYPRAGHVIAVSQGVADGLIADFGVRADRLSVIANPVDHDHIATMAAVPPDLAIEGPYCVAAGRLVANKNFAMLIDAFARAGIAGRLVILGEGPERPALEAQVKRLGLHDRVVMPGFVANPFALFARASLFALPSNAEGFPNGLIEAMACGLPVVATNCASGPSEILAGLSRTDISGPMAVDAGALVPTDATDDFAAALRAVSAEPRRTQSAAAARRRSLDYGVAVATEHYWRCIERTLAGMRSHTGSATAQPMPREAMR